MRHILSLLVVVLTLWPSLGRAEQRPVAPEAEEPPAEESAEPASEEASPPDEERDEGGVLPEHRRLRLILLEVDFSEGVEAPLRERLQRTLVDAMSRQNLDVVEPATVEETMRPLGRSMSESCRAGRCVGWILEFLDGDVGLVAHIDAFENSYSVTLTLLGQYGDEIGRAERRCDICTFDELADSVAIAGSQLIDQIPRRVFVGRVSIFPEPESAAISVDGVAIGHGALSLTLPVGLHVIEARLTGYEPEREEVMLRADDTLRLDLELHPGVLPEPDEERPVMWRPALWTTATVGLVAALTGVILMGVHGSCRDEPTNSVCQNAFAAGVGVFAGGLGAGVVSGIALGLLSAESDHR